MIKKLLINKQINKLTAFSLIKKVNFDTKPSITQLNNRTLFLIHGQDTNKFLQGLITNDINQISSANNVQNIHNLKYSIYTLFLNPKGRIVTDAIITRPMIYSNGNPSIVQQKDQFFVQIPKEAKQIFISHLKKYMWKKNVQIEEIPLKQKQGLSMYAGYTADKNTQKYQSASGYLAKQPLQNGQAQSYVQNIIFDPRNPIVGIKILADPFSLQINIKDMNFVQSAKFQSHLASLGIAPFNLMFDRLPFQFNADLLNGVSFDKGCYLGQQIVSRGYLTGMIRKRIFPFETDFSNNLLGQNSILKTSEGKQIGKVLTFKQGYGLVLVNYLQFIEEKFPLKFVSPITGRVKSPFHWKILNYYQSMKKNKQILQSYQQ